MNKVRLLFFFCFSLLFTESFGNDSCDCLLNFKYISNSVKENYPAYTRKVNPNTKIFYNKLVKEITEKTKNEKNPYNCYLLLKKYMDFFRDMHLTVGFNSNPDIKKDLIQIFSSLPKYIPKVKNSFHKLSPLHTYLDPLIIGEYQSNTSATRVRILRDGDLYYGLITSADSVFWFKGQTKFILKFLGKDFGKVKYYKRDHFKVDLDFHFDRGRIVMINGDIFDKVSNTDSNSKNHYLLPSFSSLSDSTSLITIHSFEYKNKTLIDSIVSLNWSALMSKPNLIIDIRNNGGGASSCFDTLLGLIYSKPYLDYGSYFMCSDENINLKYKDISPYYSKDYVDSFINELQLSRGKMKLLRPVDSILPSHNYLNPKKIATLVDGGSVSAAEIFCDIARQSNKVQLMGMNTRGGFDNLNTYRRSMPCELFRFFCPVTETASGIYIDDIGFKPGVQFKISDYSKWIQKAQGILENSTKEKKNL